MKALAASFALLAASCASTADTIPDSRIGLHAGYRGLDGEDWGPVDDQGAAGLEFVHEAPGSTVGLEAAVFASEKTEDDVFVLPAAIADFRGRALELSFGLHKDLAVRYEGVHPYFGGGLSLLRVELRGEQAGLEDEEDGDSAGLYLHGGVEFDLSPALFLGVDLRVRGGTDVDLLGEDRSTSYGQVSFVLGVRF
ncbi:MAG: hypothetical protein ACKVXR_03455 [Planctomycetota bacterium]